VPDAAHLTAFLAAALLLAVIPGPRMLDVLARSLAGGKPRQRTASGLVLVGLGGAATVSRQPRHVAAGLADVRRDPYGAWGGACRPAPVAG
jgi:hypothetical protein